MTDEHLIESAMATQEMELQNSIAKARNQAGVHTLEPNGACYDCGEEFDQDDPNLKNKKFCDGECQAYWEKWYKAKVRTYGPNFKPRAAY